MGFLKQQSVRKKLPAPLETHEQQHFVTFARMMLVYRYRNLLYSIPNEGKRNYKNASRMIAEGLVKGIPDLQLAIAIEPYHGLYIEMKRIRGSKTTEEQKEMAKLLKEQGYRVEVCKGFDQARSVFMDYLKNTKYIKM